MRCPRQGRWHLGRTGNARAHGGRGDPLGGGVVLIRRASDPFEGQWALPGGFVEVGETVETAATREAAEETGLAVELAGLVGVYSDPDRDPRGHNVSVAFLARVLGGDLAAATDAAEVASLDPNSVDLAFDHARIIADATGEPDAGLR